MRSRSIHSTLMPALATLLAVTGCGPAELPRRPWELPVPDGLRILDHAPVTAEARADEHIGFVDDLVIGGPDDDVSFYRVSSVEVDENGRIFAVDGGENHVRVFASDGTQVAILGGPGQGPGEFQQPSGAVVDETGRLYVLDRRNFRISIWTSDLEHVQDLPTPPQLLGLLAVRADGSFLVSTYSFSMETAPNESNMRSRVGVLSREGDLGEPWADFDMNNVPTVVRGDRQSFFSVNPRPYPIVVGRPGGGFFLTLGGEYQVVAYDATGAPEWALTSPVEPRPLPEELVDRIFETVSERIEGLSRSELILAETLPAIMSLNVDAAGRLYVYPHIAYDPENPPDRFPVDVYSPTGERIFVGTMQRGRWSAFDDEYVYASILDSENGEHQVVRRRMMAPFIRRVP